MSLSRVISLLFSEQYSAMFRKTVWVSFVYVVASISLKFFLGMCMALLLNERFRGRAIMRRYGFLLPGESLAEIR